MQNWQKNDNETDVKLGSPSLFLTSGIKARVHKTLSLVDFKDKVVLDAGCGVGIIMKEFLKYTSSVYGTEIDSRKVDIAKSAGISNVYLVNDDKLPKEFNSKFDIIFSHEVLEHVGNDQVFINESSKALKPDGSLILFIPNKWFPFETHGIYIGKKFIFGNIPFVSMFPEILRKYLVPHARIYSYRKIEDILKNAGLTIMHHEYIAPGFNRIGSRNKVTKLIGKTYQYLVTNTYFKIFGISHFIIAQKIKYNAKA